MPLGRQPLLGGQRQFVVQRLHAVDITGQARVQEKALAFLKKLLKNLLRKPLAKPVLKPGEKPVSELGSHPRRPGATVLHRAYDLLVPPFNQAAWAQSQTPKKPKAQLFPFVIG
jgi:hypothetical protein